jgi:hypothetical protein
VYAEKFHSISIESKWKSLSKIVTSVNFLKHYTAIMFLPLPFYHTIYNNFYSCFSFTLNLHKGLVNVNIMLYVMIIILNSNLKEIKMNIFLIGKVWIERWTESYWGRVCCLVVKCFLLVGDFIHHNILLMQLKPLKFFQFKKVFLFLMNFRSMYTQLKIVKPILNVIVD